MKNSTPAFRQFQVLKNAVLFVLLSAFAGSIFTSCSQSQPDQSSPKSPDAPAEAYQNRTPDQLLKVVALRQIKKEDMA